MRYFRYRSMPDNLYIICASALMVAILAIGGQTSPAQTEASYFRQPEPTGATAAENLDLPDAPEPQNAAQSAPHARTPRFAPAPKAPLYNKYIEPSQRAQPLTGFERKIAFGVNQIASPYFLVAVISSAGYEHAVNSSPNYGTDKGAFGQRLGAAAIRDASQSIFTDGLMPAVFHQDPRYYVMGKSHNVFTRGGYAVSRVFITRSDKGAAAPNYSLFAGHAETAILQNAYYPDGDRGVGETVKGFAGSFAGAALSNGIREFFPDLLHLVHLE